jgi:uncharacterized membrane protein
MDRRLHTATREQPLLEMFIELADDFKAWVTAEIAVVKAQMENNTRKLLTAVILLIVAAVIALAGMVVLAHTLVLVLAPYFGAALAGFAIGALLIILAVAFLLYARSAMDLTSLVPSRLSKVLSSQKARRS